MGLVARTFRLPEELWAALDLVAEERGQSKTVVLRRALEQALAVGTRAGSLAGRGSATSTRVDASATGAVTARGASRPPASVRASVAKKAPAAGKAAPLKESWAKTYGVPDPVPQPVVLGRRGGKRPGGFVPRPKKGS